MDFLRGVGKPAVFLALAVAVSGPAWAQGKPTLIGSFKDWFAYSSGTGADKTCYALSEPKQTMPAGVKRDPIFFLISTFPAKNTKAEPSIVPGYQYKDGAMARAEIGNDKFDFFTRNDGAAGGAWMEKPADEARLIDTMKRGATMSVTGTSARGTLTRDTYSLSGISAALAKVDAACK